MWNLITLLYKMASYLFKLRFLCVVENENKTIRWSLEVCTRYTFLFMWHSFRSQKRSTRNQFHLCILPWLNIYSTRRAQYGIMVRIYVARPFMRDCRRFRNKHLKNTTMNMLELSSPRHLWNVFMKLFITITEFI